MRSAGVDLLARFERTEPTSANPMRVFSTDLTDSGNLGGSPNYLSSIHFRWPAPPTAHDL
jgi:hypothetical protein